MRKRVEKKWVQWIQYKKEIKDSYKSPQSAGAKARQLSKYPEDVAIQMIDESIANGYKGIFPLKETNGNQVEPKQVYKQPEQKQVSDYKPEKFDNLNSNPIKVTIFLPSVWSHRSVCAGARYQPARRPIVNRFSAGGPVDKLTVRGCEIAGLLRIILVNSLPGIALMQFRIPA